MRRARRVAIALAAVAMLAGACGGSSGTSSASSPTPSPSPSPSAVRFTTVDACTLVTAADASTAAGGTMTQVPTGGAASAASICIFGSQTSGAAVLVLAQVYADQSAADSVSTDQVAAVLGAQYGISGVANARSVSGIGDKAVEYTATSASGSGMGIFVFRNNVLLFIVVSPGSDPSKIEALAQIAVTNLDKAPHS